jgi:hypothetical protein
MLHLHGPGSRLCDGLTRRRFLTLGGVGLAGLSLPGLFQARAAGRPGAPRAKSVIQLFMWGGPSQLETFDLKPNAPEGVRSQFRATDTRVPGVRICEHLPMLAQRTDRFAVLRSVTHTGTNHGTSAYHMLTGHIHFTPGTLRHPTPNDFPSVGCSVGKFGRQAKEVPNYVALPLVVRDGDGGEVPGQGHGVLGSKFAPFWALGDPTRPDFSIETLTLPAETDPGRLRERIGLREALDQREDVEGVDAHYQQGFRLLQSAATQKAFNLAAESDRVRDRYGWHPFAQSCLLARRLVEAGVPMITVYWNNGGAPGSLGNWDTHADNAKLLKEMLLPPFDRAMSALLDDLHGRGLLDETLVTWFGEFGRTPKINKSGGRDHWGFCQSVLMAGAGVRGGQVYGSSDGSAAYAAELPVSPDDLAATVFDSLGIDPDQELRDAQGRPLPLCSGKPVHGLF